MKISIITINLNNRGGLEKTAASVVSQTVTDYEWIVIDGGSTDGSVEIIKKYSDKIAYWISEPDKGIYNAMNKGIRQAKGEYCLFLNSGDWLSCATCLEDISVQLDGSDIVAGYVIEESSSHIIYPPAQLTPRYLIPHNISHQAEFIKTNLIKQIGPYSEDLKIMSDFEFNLKCSLANCSYNNINHLISYVEPGGISNTDSSGITAESQLVLRRTLSPNVDADYRLFLDTKTYSHPALSWAINKKWPFRIIVGLYYFLKKI